MRTSSGAKLSLYERGLLAAIVALLIATPASATEYTGRVDRVVDGDTFWLCDANACRKMRLCGINAPERGEVGFRRATAALKVIVLTKEVRCVQVGNGTPCDGRSRPTHRDRIVAQCFLVEIDIAELMVRRGSACDWVKYSGGYYSKDSARRRCPQ